MLVGVGDTEAPVERGHVQHSPAVGEQRQTQVHGCDGRSVGTQTPNIVHAPGYKLSM